MSDTRTWDDLAGRAATTRPTVCPRCRDRQRPVLLASLCEPCAVDVFLSLEALLLEAKG